MLPGQRISVDHYVRGLPGHICSYTGYPQEKYMLHGEMIFTDHANRYVSTGHKVNISYRDSLRYKIKCERYATNYGVLVQACYTENGGFYS